MKFYNRQEELDILNRNLEQSKRSSCFRQLSPVLVQIHLSQPGIN